MSRFAQDCPDLGTDSSMFLETLPSWAIWEGRSHECSLFYRGTLQPEHSGLLPSLFSLSLRHFDEKKRIQVTLAKLLSLFCFVSYVLHVSLTSYLYFVLNLPPEYRRLQMTISFISILCVWSLSTFLKKTYVAFKIRR